MGAHAATRSPAFSYRGFHAYFVTCCAGHRRAHFADAGCVDIVRRHLLHLAGACDFEVSAYCFMPDHVHVLLEATSVDSELSRLMNSWKQHTGYAHARGTGSRLWQNGYYDHVLRNDEDRLGIIAYLLSNPLRAGLVSDLSRYPFWGSGVWERDQLLEAVQHVIAERTRR
jgi:putative transposase